MKEKADVKCHVCGETIEGKIHYIQNRYPACERCFYLRNLMVERAEKSLKER